MLLGQGFSQFLWSFDNYGANPSATPGTSVTPGASNGEGTYTQIASSANIANDVYWVYLRVSDGFLAANAKNHLLDVGVDPAGGTSYTAVVSNLVCGGSPAITATGGGHNFFFPLFIKAGSSVAVRIQGSNATAGTVRVAAKFYGQPSRLEAVRAAHIAETIGTITNSNGVSFTPGNAADGTWVSLGTTANPLWWWLLGFQLDSGSASAEYVYIDLAYGDGSNKHIIKRLMHGGTTSEVASDCLKVGNTAFVECYCPVPAGATLYVRGRCNNAPDTGYNAVAVGFGG